MPKKTEETEEMEEKDEKIVLPVKPDLEQIAIQNHIMLKELLKIAKE